MKKVINLIIKISFVVYILALCVILFFGSRGRWDNFSILEYAAMQIAIANLLGNFLLFMPMGIYLPLLFQKIRSLVDFLLYMIPVLSLVELVQLLTKRGSFDIDDLILNLAGAILGFFVWKSEAGQKVCKRICQQG